MVLVLRRKRTFLTILFVAVAIQAFQVGELPHGTDANQQQYRRTVTKQEHEQVGRSIGTVRFSPPRDSQNIVDAVGDRGHPRRKHH